MQDVNNSRVHIDLHRQTHKTKEEAASNDQVQWFDIVLERFFLKRQLIFKDQIPAIGWKK